VNTAGEIIAIGGGGFTHGVDPSLDDFCLEFVSAKPKVGFVGLASLESEEKIELFYERFGGQGATLSHLPHCASETEAKLWLAGKHLVYFGGGNTAHLIAQLKSMRLVQLFRRANAEGLVMAGVSAGGVCWFDWALSDAGGQGYAPLAGLGFVASSVCPHYSEEPQRRPVFERLITDDPTLAGYAIDDGACLVAQSGHVLGSFTARDHAAVHFVKNINGTATSLKLAPYVFER
jgi:dipeptidase E